MGFGRPARHLGSPPAAEAYIGLTTSRNLLLGVAGPKPMASSLTRAEMAGKVPRVDELERPRRIGGFAGPDAAGCGLERCEREPAAPATRIVDGAPAPRCRTTWPPSSSR